MQVEQIEEKKHHYTDKYVVVDTTRPELARFRGLVGQVKTVNMSGRALVEFMDYHLNIGWYDIDPAFLQVVDKPPPKVEKPAAKKPAAKPAAAAKTPATDKPKPAPAKAGKPSVADVLAAARAGKGTAAKTGEAASATGTAKAEVTPPSTEPQAPAKVDRSKLSVAEMLAMARAGGSAGSVPAKAQAPAKTEAAVTPAEQPQVSPAEEPAVPAAPADEAAAVAADRPAEKVDKSTMSIDDIIAWCRQRDAK